jgi:hypothetical protein
MAFLNILKNAKTSNAGIFNFKITGGPRNGPRAKLVKLKILAYLGYCTIYSEHKMEK